MTKLSHSFVTDFLGSGSGSGSDPITDIMKFVGEGEIAAVRTALTYVARTLGFSGQAETIVTFGMIGFFVLMLIGYASSRGETGGSGEVIGNDNPKKKDVKPDK